MLMPYKFPMG